MRGLFLIILCVLSITQVYSQTQYVLNNTAYAAYYTTYCTKAPYPPACTPFSDPLLWIPQGVPDANSIVNVSSTEQLDLAIANISTINLGKLSLNGAITVFVEGSLILRQDSGYSLVVCDTSDVYVQSVGALVASYAAFFDNSTFVHLSGTVAFTNVFSGGAEILFWFLGEPGARAQFGQVTGLVDKMVLLGQAFLSSTSTINVTSLQVIEPTNTGPYIDASIAVQSDAMFQGNFYLLSLVLQANAFVQIQETSCPNIDSIVLQGNARLDIAPKDVCTLQALTLTDQSVAALYLSYAFTLETLQQVFTNGTTNVVNIHQASTSSPSVYLPFSLGITNINLYGELNITAGVADNTVFIFGQIYSQGNSTVTANYAVLANGFQMSSLKIVVPANGTLFLDVPLQLPSSLFVWENYSTVEIDADGVISAASLHLSEGQKLVLSNSRNNSNSLVLGSLHIGQGASLIAKNAFNSYIGSTHVEGAISLAPHGGQGFAELAIYGNLTVRNGTINLPQTVQQDSTASSSFLSVFGEANLGGQLNINLGGRMPSNYSHDKYDEIYAVMNATTLNGTFQSLTYSFAPSLETMEIDGLGLFFRLSGNVVYVDLKHRSDHNESTKMWAAIGGSIGAVVVAGLLVGIIVYIARKRRSEYRKVATMS